MQDDFFWNRRNPKYNGLVRVLEASMTARLSSLLLLSIMLGGLAVAKDKDKDKTKSALPEDVLRAQTVLVVIDPDAGEPVNNPMANSTARDNVEKALNEWGRFRLVMDGTPADLIISVRTGNGQSMQPTIKGGPIDQRPGVAQGTDSTIRIGGHTGQPPQQNDPGFHPQERGPHVSNEVGPSEDVFAVYRGTGSYPLDAPPVWRYTAKNCLRAPQVEAVEKFRKAVTDSQKPTVPQQKQP